MPADPPLPSAQTNARLRDPSPEALADAVANGTVRRLDLWFRGAVLGPGHLEVLRRVAPDLEELRIALTGRLSSRGSVSLDGVLAIAEGLHTLSLEGAVVASLGPSLPSLRNLNLALPGWFPGLLDRLEGATALTSLRLYRAPAHGIDRVVGLGRLRRLDLDLTGTPRWTALAALRPDTVALSGRGLDDALLHALTPSLFSRVAGLRLVTEIGEAPELAAGLVRLLDETHELTQLQLCGFTVSPVAAARLRGPLPANTEIQLVEPVPRGLLGIPGVRGTRPDQRGWGPLS